MGHARRLGLEPLGIVQGELVEGRPALGRDEEHLRPFPGGDRGLVDDVLGDPRLRQLAALRRDAFLDVGEPTKAVLLETPKQFRAVDVHIVEPGDRV